MRENPTFAPLIASRTVVSFGVNLADAGSTERVRAELVSGNYFSVLGVAPSMGRALSEDDDRLLGGHPFDSSSDVVGRAIHLNGHSYTIVGVMPDGFFGTRPCFTTDAPFEERSESGGARPDRRA